MKTSLKMKKRLMSLIIAFIFLFSMMAPVFAANGDEESMTANGGDIFSLKKMVADGESTVDLVEWILDNMGYYESDLFELFYDITFELYESNIDGTKGALVSYGDIDTESMITFWPNVPSGWYLLHEVLGSTAADVFEDVDDMLLYFDAETFEITGAGGETGDEVAFINQPKGIVIDDPLFFLVKKVADGESTSDIVEWLWDMFDGDPFDIINVLCDISFELYELNESGEAGALFSTGELDFYNTIIFWPTVASGWYLLHEVMGPAASTIFNQADDMLLYFNAETFEITGADGEEAAFINTPANGSNTPKINVSSTTAGAGDEVILTVSLENNPGITAMMFDVNFDDTALQLIETNNSMRTALLNGWNAQTSAIGGPSPVRFSWSDGPGGDNDNNGVIANLKFKILTSVPGELPITLTLFKDSITNAALNKVRFSTNDGSVTIEGVDCEHEYVGAVTTQATCDATGLKTYTCEICGDTKTEIIPALGHDWDEGEITVPATEDEDGVMTFTCNRCGETYTMVIPATGKPGEYTPVAIAPGYGNGHVWVVYNDTGASGVVYDLDAWNAIGGFGSNDYEPIAIAPGYGDGYVWVVYNISGASDVVLDWDAWKALGGFGSNDYEVIALAPGYGDGYVWVVYSISGASDVVYNKQAWLDLGGYDFTSND